MGGPKRWCAHDGSEEKHIYPARNRTTVIQIPYGLSCTPDLGNNDIFVHTSTKYFGENLLSAFIVHLKITMI
jgi:hypothetical protein